MIKINFLHPSFSLSLSRIPRDGNSFSPLPIFLSCLHFSIVIGGSQGRRRDVVVIVVVSLHGDDIIVLTRSNGNYTDLVILRRRFTFNEERPLYDSILSPLSRVAA